MRKAIAHKPKQAWSREIKTQAAIQYAICGSLSQIERDMDIPTQTLSEWKQNDEHWHDTVGKHREENDDKILANAAKIIDLAQKRTIEAMPDATAAQASIVGATWVDKGRLIRNQPTSIRGDSGTVQALALEFKQLAEASRNVVSVQNATPAATHEPDQD